MTYLSSFILSFLIVRFRKETKFYKSLEEWDYNLDVTNIREAETPLKRCLKKHDRANETVKARSGTASPGIGE